MEAKTHWIHPTGGIIHPKITVWLSFNNSDVDSNWYDFLWNTKEDISKIFLSVFVNAVKVNSIQFKFICIALFTIQSLQSALQEIKFLQYIYTL